MGPPLSWALLQSDAITTVSAFLKEETRKLFAIDRPIDVIHNFFAPRTPRRSRADAGAELGVCAQVLILHCSNLRPVKRIDLFLDAAERILQLVLVVQAGHSRGREFCTLHRGCATVASRAASSVGDKVNDIEDYWQAADLGFFTSETESFCLSILEGMVFACPSVSTSVGGIPEVVENEVTGAPVLFGDAASLALAQSRLLSRTRCLVRTGPGGAKRRPRPAFPRRLSCQGMKCSIGGCVTLPGAGPDEQATATPLRGCCYNIPALFMVSTKWLENTALRSLVAVFPFSLIGSRFLHWLIWNATCLPWCRTH